MDFENSPPTDPVKQEIIEPRPAKKSIYPPIIGGLVFLLICTWLYIVWNNNRNNIASVQKDNVIINTSTQRDSLQIQLSNVALKYDELKSLNSIQDSAIIEKNKEIQETRARIQTLLSKANATLAELAEAKSLIAALNNDLTSYREQIETLQGEKIQLKEEKAALIQDRDKVKKDFDSSQALIKEKNALIDKGSTLHASNFTITGINEKGNGREKETTTAKRVDKLRISFDLDENMITPSGKKELYVIIITPEGKTVSEGTSGSGKFTLKDGTIKDFTQKMDINYTQNKKQTVSFEWKPGSKFTTGDYKIEVYNNGFKIGEGVQTMKKGGLFS